MIFFNKVSHVFLTLFYIFRKTAVKVVSIFFLSGAIGAIALNVLWPIPLFESRQAPANFSRGSDKSNVYFFILDEHAGLESLKSYKKISEELKTRYGSRGFNLYEKAFTNYKSTLDSIPSILNGKIYSDRQIVLAGNKLIQNKIFDVLAQKGYAVNVYESTHISFRLHPAVRKVFIYKESSAGYVQGIKLGVAEKFWVLLDAWVSGTKSVPVKKLYARLFRSGNDEFFMTGALPAQRVLEEVRRDSLLYRSGRVFFVHLLIPHSSYIFTADGSIRSPFTWESSHGGDLKEGDGRVNRPQDRFRKYRQHIEQIHYLHSQLDLFFDHLNSNHMLDEATIILMSDHGSRIYLTPPLVANEPRLTREDFLDAYNGFLAVKLPKSDSKGVRQNYIPEDPVSSAKIVGEVFGLTEFVHNGDLDNVYLNGGDAAAPFKAVPISQALQKTDIDY